MLVVIDDILAYSKALVEHAQHLSTTLEVLRKNELCAKLKKCELWLEKVAFLGHMVSKEGVSINPTKDRGNYQMAYIEKCYFGTTHPWASRALSEIFFQDFSKIAMPLTSLTSTRVKYEWTERCVQAF